MDAVTDLIRHTKTNCYTLIQTGKHYMKITMNLEKHHTKTDSALS
jgi:hypothetical protein